jgi:hypothetical protein
MDMNHRRLLRVTAGDRENAALVRAELYRALVGGGLRVAVGQRFRLPPAGYRGARARAARPDLVVIRGGVGEVVCGLSVGRYLRAGAFDPSPDPGALAGPGSGALGVPWALVGSRAAIPDAVAWAVKFSWADRPGTKKSPSGLG